MRYFGTPLTSDGRMIQIAGQPPLREGAENSDFPVIEPRLSRYRGKIIDIVSFTIIERSGVTTTTDWQYYAI